MSQLPLFPEVSGCFRPESAVLHGLRSLVPVPLADGAQQSAKSVAGVQAPTFSPKESLARFAPAPTSGGPCIVSRALRIHGGRDRVALSATYWAELDGIKALDFLTVLAWHRAHQCAACNLLDFRLHQAPVIHHAPHLPWLARHHDAAKERFGITRSGGGFTVPFTQQRGPF